RVHAGGDDLTVALHGDRAQVGGAARVREETAGRERRVELAGARRRPVLQALTPEWRPGRSAAHRSPSAHVEVAGPGTESPRGRRHGARSLSQGRGYTNGRRTGE